MLESDIIARGFHAPEQRYFLVHYIVSIMPIALLLFGGRERLDVISYIAFSAGHGS